MKTWVWAGGRPDHTEGAHDDDIMAMAILIYNIPKIKQIVPKGEEANKKMAFINEEGREVTVSRRDDYDDAFEEKKEAAIERFTEEQGMPDGFADDAYNIWQWLIS